MREYRMQLKDGRTGETIITTGGTCVVCKDGSPDKETLYNKDGGALANPISATRGFLNFFTGDDVAKVDLYIMAPGGQFMVATGVRPSGDSELIVNSSRFQLAKIPFSILNATAAVEQDTGYDLLATAMVLDRLHGAGVLVVTAEGSRTIDVGLLSSETGGDADGLIAASSLAAAGQVLATNGALFSTNAPHRGNAVTAKSISYTLSASTAAAKGFILLPYMLNG